MLGVNRQLTDCRQLAAQRGIADALRLHLAFVTTRVHRRGELGNAILSRWPITSVFTLYLTFSNVERRSVTISPA